MKVVYLFTTFPLLSETFLQREVRALRSHGVEIELYSLWGGGGEFEGLRVHTFPKWNLAALAWSLPRWTGRRPSAIVRTLVSLCTSRPSSALNFGANLIGYAFALLNASRIRSRDGADLLNATWATMPGAAGQLIHALTDIPFALGAHAYDVFEDGGDWQLEAKLRDASLVVTSTEATRAELLRRGSPTERTLLIRRGLELSSLKPTLRRPRDPIRTLSVGRLVEKKGFVELLRLYAALASSGLRFEARLIGDGPLAETLRRERARLGLEDRVRFLGAQPYDAVVDQYAWADVLMYSGRIAASGDRDGLPNVVPEAMAAGLAVVSTPVGGVSEAIEDGVNGLLIADSQKVGPWAQALLRLQGDDAFYRRITAAARGWVVEHFDATRNAGVLLENFQEVVARTARRDANSDPILTRASGS